MVGVEGDYLHTNGRSSERVGRWRYCRSGHTSRVYLLAYFSVPRLPLSVPVLPNTRRILSRPRLASFLFLKTTNPNLSLAIGTPYLSLYYLLTVDGTGGGVGKVESYKGGGWLRLRPGSRRH